jgi:hypothetical protein
MCIYIGDVRSRRDVYLHRKYSHVVSKVTGYK